MPTADRIYWLHALTPLHVGAGKGEGYIDLPLMREKLTNYPFVPGSSVKGVFADSHGARDEIRNPKDIDDDGNEIENPQYSALLHAAFGRAGDDTANAGALVFTDAQLVCLPVRSLYGTFAWCTCPLVLQRLTRDLESAGLAESPAAPVTAVKQAESLIPDAESPESVLTSDVKIYLEDLDLSFRKSNVATQWAGFLARQLFPADRNSSGADWQQLFQQRFTILSDEVFSFLAETATEVQPHVRIEPDFKRVAKGALWYEESLPAESILCGLVWCDPPRAHAKMRPAIEELLKPQCVQMGGKATTGKGRVQMRFSATTASGKVPTAGGINR